jgi:uncharacterized membrane protein
MPVTDHIRNPIEWISDEVKAIGGALERAEYNLRHPEDSSESAIPTVVQIKLSDLWEVLRKGFDDLGAYRSDVLFICLIYPIAGLVLSRVVVGYDMLPLVFPLVSGFALIGPLAALGLYEISRRREQGAKVNWADALGVVRAPALPAIIVLGLLLLAIFLLWMGAAYLIYLITLGPESPASIGSFFGDVFTTAAGWAMIVVGIGVGFLFAVLVLTISVVSFPLLLDRNVGVVTAVKTSIRAVLMNPVPMAAWGLIVAGSLVIGSLPALLGLIFVLPVLGHATWHLYRKVIAP